MLRSEVIARLNRRIQRAKVKDLLPATAITDPAKDTLFIDTVSDALERFNLDRPKVVYLTTSDTTITLSDWVEGYSRVISIRYPSTSPEDNDLPLTDYNVRYDSDSDVFKLYIRNASSTFLILYTTEHTQTTTNDDGETVTADYDSDATISVPNGFIPAFIELCLYLLYKELATAKMDQGSNIMKGDSFNYTEVTERAQRMAKQAMEDYEALLAKAKANDPVAEPPPFFYVSDNSDSRDTEVYTGGYLDE